jgi:SNF2 family DNA or RNA helicase
VIITYWKGIFVVDKANNPDERSMLKKAGFVLHEPSICPLDKRCKACRAGVGSRYWSNMIESATRLRPLCNQRALDAMKEHLGKLAKSRATTSDIVVPAPPDLKFEPYQRAGVAYALAHKDTYNGDDMGLGKAQSLDAKILTPSGWTTMGEIKKEDLVVGSDGHSYPVIGVYPQGKGKVFHVTFQDGASAECDEQHFWEVNTPLRHHRGYAPKILTTRQIIDIGLTEKNGNRRHFIRLAKSYNYSKKDLTIDPYVMGYLLGNGGLSQDSVRVTIPDRESVERFSSLLPNGFILSQQNPIDYIITTANPQRGRRNPFLAELRRLTLMGHLTHEKFIPSEYLWTSTSNRVSLLQGLIDSDGHVRPKDGNIEYTSSSSQLAKDVQQLIWSLGGIAKIRPKKTKRRMSYRMSVILPNDIVPCRLSRKLAHHRTRPKYPPSRSITKIEYVGIKETQCIAIDSPDHLYVTDDFILTHNTIQTLGFINCLRSTQPDLNTLILCPGPLTFNWREEALKWLVPGKLGMPEIVIPTSTSFEVPKRSNLLVITNYEKIVRDTLLSDSLKRIWDVLVCDEAQALKNWAAKRTQAVLGPEGFMQRAHRTTFLSGTPIENYPKEIWSIAAAIAPAKFGDWWEFARCYCGLHKEVTADGHSRMVDTGATNLGELQQRLRSTFMIRRLKGDVLKELPPKRRQLILLGNSKVDWSKDPDFKRWQELYERDYEQKLAALESAKTQDEYRRAVRLLDDFKGVAFEEMSALRHKTAVAKLPACIEYLDQMLTTKIDKLVIFAHHQEVLEALAHHFGVDAVSLHGKTKVEDRELAKKRFNTPTAEGGARILIGGLKVAGVGHNLQVASTGVFIEIDWNPATMTQAEDRMCRFGQKKMVHIIHLVLEGTLDVRIVKRVIAKQEVVDKALNRSPEHGLKLTGQTMLALRC